MHKNVLAWTVQTLVVWCLNTMISICQRGQSSYCEMTHEFTTAWREPAVSLFICAWKRQISMLALTDCNKFEQQTCMLPLCISWILCFSTAFLCGATSHFCMFVLHRWGLISIVPVESKRKTSRERIVMIAYGKDHRVNAFKFVLFLPTEQAKLVTFCFSYKYISQFNLHLA